MTLAVGRVVGRHINLAADWHLTHVSSSAPHYQRGALKVVIIHPHVAVAYAGNVYTAINALRAFPAVDQSTSADDFLPDLLSHLQTASSRSDSDFLVGRAGDSPQLARVQDGGQFFAATGAQIGAREAVEALLAFEEQRRPIYDEMWHDLETDLKNSLRAGRGAMTITDLIQRGEGGSTIGLLAVDARSDDDGNFRYNRKTTATSTQPQEIVGDPFLRAEAERRNEELRRIDGGTVQLDVIPAAEPGVGALALHFPERGVGLFAFPMRVGADLVTYTDVDAQALADQIAQDYGVVIEP